ncbi:hypothetical protein DFP73DRAFT_529927 [Morchella snyderi]|nr:hypothetical protein DFP73DRAFT_529927 [Morchella snyderi]
MSPSTTSKLVLIGEIWYLLEEYYNLEEIMGYVVRVHSLEDTDVPDKLNSQPFFDLVRQLATIFLQLQSQLQSSENDTGACRELSRPTYKSLRQTIAILVGGLKTLLSAPGAGGDLPVQHLLVTTILAGFRVLGHYSDENNLPHAPCTSLLKKVLAHTESLQLLSPDEKTMLQICLELAVQSPLGTQLNCLSSTEIGLYPFDPLLFGVVEEMISGFETNWLRSYCAIYDIIHSIAISIVQCEADHKKALQNPSKLYNQISSCLQAASIANGIGVAIHLKKSCLVSLANLSATIQSELCETPRQSQGDGGNVNRHSREELELQSLQRFRDLLLSRKEDVFHLDRKAQETISRLTAAASSHNEGPSSDISNLQRLYSLNCPETHHFEESAISCILQRNHVEQDSTNFEGLALSNPENCPKCSRPINYLREVEPVRRIVDEARKWIPEEERWRQGYLDRGKVAGQKAIETKCAKTPTNRREPTRAGSPISSTPTTPSGTSPPGTSPLNEPLSLNQPPVGSPQSSNPPRSSSSTQRVPNSQPARSTFSESIRRLLNLGRKKRSCVEEFGEDGNKTTTGIRRWRRLSFGFLGPKT